MRDGSWPRGPRGSDQGDPSDPRMRRAEASGRYPRGYPPDASGAGSRRPPYPNRPSSPGSSGASLGGYGARTSYGPARSSQRAHVPNYGSYPNRPSGPGGPTGYGPANRPPNTDRDNPYRSYDPNATSARASYSRMSATGRFPADLEEDTGLTSSRLEAVQRHRHGFALFHDGNAGHLWRGEVAAQFGDAIFSVGVVMWLAYLTASPFMVALGVALLGLPWLLAGPLAAPLQNVREPGRPLLWLGRLRALCALGLVAMHFYTIYPAIFGLIFLVGLTGRLREGLRVAATRVCLEPGEPELVSNDLYIGSALSATLGPLLASVLFIGLGERIILIGVAAGVCYLLSSNSDGFLDALPEKKRAFLLVTPTSATPDAETREELLNAVQVSEDDLPLDLSAENEENDEPGGQALALARRKRELALPEWYQQGPQTVGQAIGELRTGMGLLGSGHASATALVNLCALALVGGGLATLEVFYLLDRLGLPEYYLGALLAAEGAGLTLGALLAGLARLRQRALPLVLMGVALSGVALAALGYANTLPVALGAAVALGLANALAVTAARRALRIGFNGVERRAIGDAEAWLNALAGVVGALLFAVFYAGVSAIPHGHALAKLPIKGLPIGELFLLTGVGLALVALFSLAAPLIWRDKPADETATDDATATSARLAQLTTQTSARLGATRSSLATPAASGGLWGEAGDSAELDAVGSIDDWDDAGDPSTYQSSYGAAYGESGEYDQYDEDDEPPARRRW